MNVALAISPTERRLRDRIDELEETVRQYLGASTSPSAYSANSTRAELTSVLTGRSLIEPYKFTDTLRDRITLIFVCMVVCSIAVLFGVFLYIGFFFRA